MDEVIVIEDRVDEQCVRHVHLMSNTPLPTASPQMASDLGGEWVKEAGVWHYRAEYAYRGVLDMACVNGGGNFRRLVVWAVGSGKLAVGSGEWGVGSGQALSVREGMKQAKAEFERLFGGSPVFAFVRRMPRGAENGLEFNGMMLFEAEWMLERAVAVGGRDAKRADVLEAPDVPKVQG